MKKHVKTSENADQSAVRVSTSTWTLGQLITGAILSYTAIRLIQEVEYESSLRRDARRLRAMAFVIFMASLIVLVSVLIAVAK